MKKQTIAERIRQWIAGIGWRLFLWGNQMTAEQYWKQVYEDEKYLREH